MENYGVSGLYPGPAPNCQEGTVHILDARTHHFTRDVTRLPTVMIPESRRAPSVALSVKQGGSEDNRGNRDHECSRVREPGDCEEDT